MPVDRSTDPTGPRPALDSAARATWSLRRQISAAGSVVVVLLALFVSLYLPARSLRAATEAKHAQLSGAAEMVALTVGVGMEQLAFEAVAEAFDWARRDPALRYVAVLDTSGTVLAAYDPDSLSLSPRAYLADRTVTTWNDHFVVSRPISYRGVGLGDVVMAASQAPMRARAEDERRTGLVLSGTLLLVGLLSSLAIGTRIARPLSALRQAAESIAAGRYETDIPRGGSTEVHALGASFGIMADRIGAQMKRLEEQARELAAARDAALSATHAKSAFLATMSHEIRTPMNGVVGMLDLLAEGELTTEQRDFIGTATRSADALLTIIDEILDFSKIEAGRLTLESVDLDLQSVVEDVTSVLAERAAGKGLELVCTVDAQLPSTLRGDPGRLRQIIMNLAGNAIKFTTRGEVVISIRQAERCGDSVGIRCEVTDTGIGIPKHVAKQLFAPFAQADASTTRRFGGTGLGLAISKQLSELMGGSIGVRSQEGVGSTFWFTARLAIAAAPAATAAAPDLTGVRVLVVDDNRTNRTVLQQQLARWGMESDAVGSGPEAIALLRDRAARECPVQVVLLDLQMPGMDGISVAELIRLDPALRGVPVILLASVGVRGLGRKAQESGLAAMLTKPVRQRQLRDALVAALAPGAERSPASDHAPPARRAAAPRRVLTAGRILLAEDNIVNQQVVKHLLERLGYVVDVVDNGREAVDAVQRASYALVLMDCQMPLMDGFAATEAIRGLGFTSDRLPIVALTANVMPEDRKRCLAAGMDDHLAKPLRRTALEAVLARLVGAEGAAPTDPADALAPTASSPAAGSALDLSALQSLFGDDPDELRKMIHLFIDSSRESITRLITSVAQHDRSAVNAAAHFLVGSASTLGAVEVTALARRIESIAGEADWDLIDRELARLRAAMDHVAAVAAGRAA
jgi:two-component system, sensor histidine kinase and response regulator